jgi:hypothetical protein
MAGEGGGKIANSPAFIRYEKAVSRAHRWPGSCGIDALLADLIAQEMQVAVQEMRRLELVTLFPGVALPFHFCLSACLESILLGAGTGFKITCH